MFFKILLFGLLNLICKSNQQLPTNLLNTLNLKNPTILYSLNEYLNNSASKTWAVLVAGSSGFDNYRHQSDVLHFYQVLTNFSGVSKEKIILMLEDDLANNKLNPEKGIIINEPNGTNLYSPDLKIDYRKEDLTVNNFLKVLKGDPQLAAAGKKVLNAKEDENVIIYYVDHGMPGFLPFPDGILNATTLNEVLEDLSNKKKFKKMLISIEACFSGSIFDQNLLKPNLSIYAITAANSKELSFSEFYDQKLDTYLSDAFSSNFIYSWISCEKDNLSIEEQYELIKNKTKDSHVSQFGDLKLAKQTKLNEFLYSSSNSKTVAKCSLRNKLDQLDKSGRLSSPSPDIKLKIFDYLSKLKKLTKDHLEVFEKLNKGRAYLKDHFFKLGEKIAELLGLEFKNLIENDDSIRSRKCYEDLVNIYHQICFKLNKHTFLSRYLHLFYKACNSLIDEKDDLKKHQLESLIVNYCKQSELKKFQFSIE